MATVAASKLKLSEFVVTL